MAFLPTSINKKSLTHVRGDAQTPERQTPHRLRAKLLGALALVIAANAPLAQAENFTVQIGAFGVAPKQTFTQEAAEYGEVLVDQGSDGITRVSIGRYPTRRDARDALSRLQMAGYTDAYVANLRDGLSAAAVANPASDKPASAGRTTTPRPAKPASGPRAPIAGDQGPGRTLTNPTNNTSRSQRLPSGSQIVPPKQTSSNDAAQAGRFRLRTHDTQSGQTRDVERVPTPTKTRRPARSVVAGTGLNDIPDDLRDKLVYLDGVPHIKEGDEFIPLTDAVDGKP